MMDLAKRRVSAGESVESTSTGEGAGVWRGVSRKDVERGFSFLIIVAASKRSRNLSKSMQSEKQCYQERKMKDGL